jgi:cAMP-dependent protein kinase regulator
MDDVRHAWYQWPGSTPMYEATHDLVVRLWADDRTAEAILAAATMLDATPDDLLAWHQLARLLAATGDRPRAASALSDLSRAYGASGDLPMAIVAAIEGADAGTDARALLAALARTFSADATALVDDWRSAPPAMPAKVEVHLGDARSAVLVRRQVETALSKAHARLDSTRPAAGRFFPLFSSLKSSAFVRFASQLDVERHGQGQVVVEQGEVGRAFYVVASGEVHVVRRSGGGEETVLARLGPGAFFGEMAIVARTPRAATVRTASDVTLLRADVEKLEPVRDEMPEVAATLDAFCRARMLENVVLASPVLRRIPIADRAELISRFRERRFECGDVIIAQGSESRGLFLLVCGEVDVTRSDADDTLALARLSPGDYFGEISLVLQRPATATVSAGTEALCLILPRDAFRQVIQQHPGLLAEVYETALKRQEETSSILAREAESAEDLVLV